MSDSSGQTTGVHEEDGFGLDDTIAQIAESIRTDRRISHVSAVPLPDRNTIGTVTQRLLHLMYPGFFPGDEWLPDQIEKQAEIEIRELAADLSTEVASALRYEAAVGTPDREKPPSADVIERARMLSGMFMRTLPEVRAMLSIDVEAAYQSDPASMHTDEIIFCYPGLYALTMHRLAHELYRLNVPLIPRMLNEAAHSATGIDIHPGARIGSGFFIDHGTGVVIGETTFIGNNCKLYQGVTLGARSSPRDADGNLKRDVQRHPTLEDNVTVYAGATILGGETIIGAGSIIDGGVFITESVPPGSVVRAPRIELDMARV